MIKKKEGILMGYCSSKANYDYDYTTSLSKTSSSQSIRNKKASTLNDAKKLVTRCMEILSEIEDKENEKKEIEKDIERLRKELSSTQEKIKNNKELSSLLSILTGMDEGPILKLK